MVARTFWDNTFEENATDVKTDVMLECAGDFVGGFKVVAKPSWDLHVCCHGIVVLIVLKSFYK